jgi:hypothetical protein
VSVLLGLGCGRCRIAIAFVGVACTLARIFDVHRPAVLAGAMCDQDPVAQSGHMREGDRERKADPAQRRQLRAQRARAPIGSCPRVRHGSP